MIHFVLGLKGWQQSGSYGQRLQQNVELHDKRLQEGRIRRNWRSNLMMVVMTRGGYGLLLWLLLLLLLLVWLSMHWRRCHRCCRVRRRRRCRRRR